MPSIPYALAEIKQVPSDSKPGATQLCEQAEAAEAQFDEARRAYENARYAEAAEGFLKAAQSYRVSPTSRAADIFRWNRIAAYQNASRAFRMADEGGKGRAALQRASVEDPDCADAIASQVRWLSGPDK